MADRFKWVKTKYGKIKARVMADGKLRFIKGTAVKTRGSASKKRVGAGPRVSRSKRSGVRRVRRRTTMARRRGGRARRYYRKAKRAISRFGMPSILGLGAGLAAMAGMGMFQALGAAAKGDFTGPDGAISQIMRKMTIPNIVASSILPIGVVMARKFIGPVPIVNAGKFRIRLL